MLWPGGPPVVALGIIALTATNFFNHPNWSNPAVNISSAAAVGVISGVGDVSDLDASGPRSFRMGIRLEF